MRLKVTKGDGWIRIEFTPKDAGKPVVIDLDDKKLEQVIALLQMTGKLKIVTLELEL